MQKMLYALGQPGHAAKLDAIAQRMLGDWRDSAPGNLGRLIYSKDIHYITSFRPDGYAHNRDDLPLLLAGKGFGTIQSGQYIHYPQETPLNKLWIGMLDRLNMNLHSLGDSTGSLGA